MWSVWGIRVATRGNQEIVSGQTPSQDVNQSLTQNDFVASGQLTETGNFNLQDQDEHDTKHNRHHNQNRTGPTMDNRDDAVILLKSGSQTEMRTIT